MGLQVEPPGQSPWPSAAGANKDQDGGNGSGELVKTPLPGFQPP